MSLLLYKVDTNYCNYLRTSDPCVPYNMDMKKTRPFIGIVLSIEDIDYFAPLTSPKPKHLQMKNSKDFMKIAGGEYGAINFNNMIPVPQECLLKVELNILPSDTEEERHYKNLLNNQLSWCNANKDRIQRTAKDLHELVVFGSAPEALALRCCNFALDEKQCRKYEAALRRGKLPPEELS